ncbi:MAG: chemotaxis protein CheW [Candidatus Acidiferrales bacterium]|jgi:chemotaxis signal transduction protein
MTEPTKSAQPSFVLLHMGKYRFALVSSAVAELSPAVKLHTFPHTTPNIEGVIVCRGGIVPVFEVASVLTQAQAPARRFYLVAKRHTAEGDTDCAIPVDGDCELRNAEMQPAPQGRALYVSGILSGYDPAIDVIDLEKLLSHVPAAIAALVSQETAPKSAEGPGAGQ